MYCAGTMNAPDPRRTYSRDMSRHDILPAEEERRLAEAAAAGDRDARARLIGANLRLVAKIAARFRGRGMDYDDLICEGNLGLTRAADRFDPGRGYRFTTYAKHWILEAIRSALRDATPTIRLPSHVYVLVSKWRRAERCLCRELGRMPSSGEVAGHLGLSEAQKEMVEKANRAGRLRLEGALSDGGEGWSLDEAVDDSEAPGCDLERADERAEVLRRIGLLEDCERAVVTLRYGLEGEAPRTLAEVGRRLGITSEWARKIEQRAVRKLVLGATAAPPRATRHTA
ncbi:RNA polymerase sigma factor SigA (plasmid) [Aquisphaera giovannonii]|uniref:RNA polymerase sigma factor SigA n=1 Tax=Aquisphaera giovannonii TaxID=406548 RepID=A0A5B9WFH2_9BACT|nr:sigma-70 family RNA polymerase sigma factor [Aquisphaera giovannonii]QEH39322.1 RNA polymerase sigma factor SigA [Aquisphaera giovannonii]